MNEYLVYTFICKNRAKIDGIKILLVGDVPDAHLVHRAMRFRHDLQLKDAYNLNVGVKAYLWKCLTSGN